MVINIDKHIQGSTLSMQIEILMLFIKEEKKSTK